MTLHTQSNRLNSLQQQERAQRGKNSPSGAQIDTAAARDIRSLSKVLSVDETMVREIRLIECREARCVLLPVEVSAVDDGSPQRCAVAAHEFRQRSYDNVRTMLNRPQQDR